MHLSENGAFQGLYLIQSHAHYVIHNHMLCCRLHAKEHCVALIEENFNNFQLRFDESGVIWKRRSADLPWLYEDGQNMDEWISDFLNGDHIWTSSSLSSIVIKRHIMDKFPSKYKLKRDRNLMSFKNGLLMLPKKNEPLELRFVRFPPPEGADDFERGVLENLQRTGLLPCHHVDADVSLKPGSRELLPHSTPLMDKFLQNQEWHDPKILQTFYALFGRLRFRIGQLDCWQVMILLGHQSGSGKTTAIEILLKCLFASNTVEGLVSDTKMGPHILEQMLQKDVISMTEMGPTFCPRASHFKMMVAGDKVQLPKGRNKSFDVPQVWASNCGLNFKNGVNSENDKVAVARRVVLFPFNRPYENSEQMSVDTILKREMANLTLKCLDSYINLVRELGILSSSSSFWNAAPQLLRTLRDSGAVFSGISLISEEAEQGTPQLGIVDAVSKFFTFTGKITDRVGQPDMDKLVERIEVSFSAQDLKKHFLGSAAECLVSKDFDGKKFPGSRPRGVDQWTWSEEGIAILRST